jgi:hypothetical protein
MFVHHVRNFPFLDRAKEKEFWQDKLQTVSEVAIQRHARADSDFIVPRIVRTQAHILI